jgi:hypothetical protein
MAAATMIVMADMQAMAATAMIRLRLVVRLDHMVGMIMSM